MKTGLLLLSSQLQKSLQTCRLVFEVLDPLVEEGKSQLLTITLEGVAAIDHDAVEVTPFGDKDWQFILFAKFLFSTEYLHFQMFQHVEQLSRISLEAV